MFIIVMNMIFEPNEKFKENWTFFAHIKTKLKFWLFLKKTIFAIWNFSLLIIKNFKLRWMEDMEDMSHNCMSRKILSLPPPPKKNNPEKVNIYVIF